MNNGRFRDFVKAFRVEQMSPFIQKALREQGSVMAAAKWLGISRKGLQLHMREFGLCAPERPRKPARQEARMRAKVVP